MTSERVVTRLQAAWRAFRESYAGLSEAELLERGVAGNWSVRDVLAHVTTWEEEALTYLPLILAGGHPPRYSRVYGGIDAFNARTTEAKRALSLDDVRREQDRVHRRLLDYVPSVPAGALEGETRFRRRLRLDTYGHYRHHAAAIRRWRGGRAAISAGDPARIAEHGEEGDGSSRDWSSDVRRKAAPGFSTSR